jgi:ubiquitin C-terminal hydrolase
MCVTGKTDTLVTLPVIYSPPMIPSLPTIPLPAPVQPIANNPIMDFTGTAPIANQIFDGTNYVVTTDKTKFIEFTGPSRSTDPKINKYYATFRKPTSSILNIVDKAKNALYSGNKGLNFNNLTKSLILQPRIARSIRNYGLSCYFDSAMQYLFAMGDVRNMILDDAIQIYQPSQSGATNQSRKDGLVLIRKFIKLMDQNLPNPITTTDFTDAEYLQIKSEFTPSSTKEEEDASEFLLKMFSDMNPVITNPFKTDLILTSYHAVLTNVLAEDYRPSETGEWIIRPSYVTNDTLENILSTSYVGELELQDGTNAISYPPNFVFGYRHNRYVKLPQYLNVIIAPFEGRNITKPKNNIKLNTTITLTTNDVSANSAFGIPNFAGKSITYILLAIVIHIGNDINSGHYTCLTFKQKNGNDLEYTLYDDDRMITHKMTIGVDDTDFIPKTFYAPNDQHTPYMVLYGDITKLN